MAVSDATHMPVVGSMPMVTDSNAPMPIAWAPTVHISGIVMQNPATARNHLSRNISFSMNSLMVL